MPKITFTNPKFGKRVDRKKDSNTNHKFSSKSQHLVVRQNVRSRIMLEKASRNKICGNWYPWNYCHTGKGPRPINRMVDLYANQLFFFFFGKRKSAYCLYQLDALFFPLFNIYYSFYINDWRPYHLMKLAIWNIGRNIHHSISAMIAVLYDQEVLGKNMLDVIYTFPFPYFCIFTLIFLYLYFLILNYIVLFNIPLKR